MSFTEITAVLGNLGEFIGAIAVVVTLFYLAIQVKQSKEATEANTRSLEEGRNLALVQTYQANLFRKSDYLMRLSESPMLPARLKYFELGYNALDSTERYYMRTTILSQVADVTARHYAMEKGLAPEYLEAFPALLREQRKSWEEFGILPLGDEFRESFKRDVERVFSEQDEEVAAAAAAQSSEEKA